MKFKIKYVFYFEVFLSVITIVMCLFMPDAFMEQFSKHTQTIEATELIRWYGILMFVITLILFRALYSEDWEVLKVVLESYLIGDLIQLVATYWFAQQIGWNFTLAFTLGITFFYAVFRVLALKKPWLVGIE